jgi:hypothetical protein
MTKSAAPTRASTKRTRTAASENAGRPPRIAVSCVECGETLTTTQRARTIAHRGCTKRTYVPKNAGDGKPEVQPVSQKARSAKRVKAARPVKPVQRTVPPVDLPAYDARAVMRELGQSLARRAPRQPLARPAPPPGPAAPPVPQQQPQRTARPATARPVAARPVGIGKPPASRAAPTRCKYSAISACAPGTMCMCIGGLVTPRSKSLRRTARGGPPPGVFIPPECRWGG